MRIEDRGSRIEQSLSGRSSILPTNEMTMSPATPPPRARRTYVWWVILCLVGLDYFSSLAYLPSIAVNLLGDRGDLAPIAGLGVVLVTLLAAVPVYWYVV